MTEVTTMFCKADAARLLGSSSNIDVIVVYLVFCLKRTMFLNFKIKSASEMLACIWLLAKSRRLQFSLICVIACNFLIYSIACLGDTSRSSECKKMKLGQRRVNRRLQLCNGKGTGSHYCSLSMVLNVGGCSWWLNSFLCVFQILHQPVSFRFAHRSYVETCC